MLECLANNVSENLLRLVRVGEDTRYQLARLVAIEEAERQPLKVTVKLVAHVAGDALLHRHTQGSRRVEEEVLQHDRDHHNDDYVTQRLARAGACQKTAHYRVQGSLHQAAGTRQHRRIPEQRPEKRDEQDHRKAVE